jgi:tetratricopeptide (TPR) repeat protein
VRERCLAGRGLVRLRLGDYDKSIKDFDEALSSNPKNAFALYGRGIAKTRLGKAGGGQADLSAAAAVWPDVAKSFAKRGMVP